MAILKKERVSAAIEDKYIDELSKIKQNLFCASTLLC